MRALLFAGAALLSACRPSAAAPAGATQPAVQPAAGALGTGAPLGRRVLAKGSAWNTPVDKEAVDPGSARFIARLGQDTALHPDFGTTYRGAPWGIPYVVVDRSQPRVPVRFTYADESDRVAYPIPARPPIESMPPGRLPENDDADHHLLLIDRDEGKLYELYQLRHADGGWRAGSGAVWELFGDTRRSEGWTSADAAGLPIFPGLVRYEEAVERGQIEHALRYTVPQTRRAYVAPATHQASRLTDSDLLPMGARLRLRATIDAASFPKSVRPIVIALQRYGMILADNGGALFLSGAPDPRWPDAEIESLKRLRARDFEVLRMDKVVSP